MQTIEDIRRANLLAVLGQMSAAALAERAGIAPSMISQWKKGAPDSKTKKPRQLSSESCRRIERAIKKPEGWMDQQHWAIDQHATAGPVDGVVVTPLAQQLSDPRQSMAPSVVPMESVRMGEVKEHFALVIEDDALDPSYPKGTIAEFRRDRPPIAGKPVLLRDRDGNVFIRRYEVRTPTHWLATAEKPGYQPLDSVRDGLEILATMTGHRW